MTATRAEGCGSDGSVALASRTWIRWPSRCTCTGGRARPQPSTGSGSTASWPSPAPTGPSHAAPATPTRGPLWGLWQHDRLHLSVGSPALGRQLRADPAVTVHLDSGTDVVIVEGEVEGPATDDELLRAYNTKYDWDYTVDEYGPLTAVRPVRVMAWRSAGWAGRDGFQQTGRWRFPTS